LECVSLCEKAKPSILRVKLLTAFHFSTLLRELKQRAPTFLSILKAAATPTKRLSEPSPIVICMAAAMLLKQRNQQMCLLQAIVAIILYAGHAAKKVSISVCIHHVMLLKNQHVWYSYYLVMTMLHTRHNASTRELLRPYERPFVTRAT